MTSVPIPVSYANHILVASPSHAVRQRVLESLRSPVRRFEQATGGAEALIHLESGLWEALFLDRHLPDLDSEELRATVRQRFPGIEIVFLNAEGAAEPSPLNKQQKENELASTWPITGSSGCYVGKDGNVRPSERGLGEVCKADETPLAPTGHIVIDSPLPGMIGNSRAMQPVCRLVRLLAPRNTSVLITGPTGSGKEIVARAIHMLSPRSARAFAVVNCAAIPETLLEAELFGCARGAFTGAMQSYAGRIQAAQGGTLFLDEIGEMPLSLQPKLLRFLEQKELQRLGSSEVVRVDARVVSATNAHLLTLVREGKFREDLYYRLSAFPLEIPPLRERPEDVGPIGRALSREIRFEAACAATIRRRPAAVENAALVRQHTRAAKRYRARPDSIRGPAGNWSRAISLADTARRYSA